MTKDMSLAAVVFDFDGVIVNTEPLHYQAYQETLTPLGLGISWNDYLAIYVGFDDRDAFREVFRRTGQPLGDERLRELIHRKAEAFRKLVERRGAEPYPGVVSLIRDLAAQIPVALCSGALRPDVDPILRKLKLTKSFSVIVTAEEVAVSKPDPASYVRAVKKLAEASAGHLIAAERCVAVEDTPAGIDAASGAGLSVLAIANTYPPAKLSQAARVVKSLDGITIDDFAALVRS